MTPGQIFSYIGIVLLVVLLLVLVISNIHVVQQSRAYVIERLGAYSATWTTGLHLKIPFIERVAKMAHLHSYIEALPDGYDTILSDDGVNISKGHKQLLTIARAMLADAPMLILDEATSNVDSRTEQRIQQAMYRLMEGRTCFVIAHRLSTIQNADTILVVKDGNVIEQGNHDALMAQKGFYYSLYHAQFE